MEAYCGRKGNKDWNYQRLMGRQETVQNQAKKQIELNDFKAAMKGIWTSQYLKEPKMSPAGLQAKRGDTSIYI